MSGVRWSGMKAIAARMPTIAAMATIVNWEQPHPDHQARSGVSRSSRAVALSSESAISR